jgi:hypothetical protein
VNAEVALAAFEWQTSRKNVSSHTSSLLDGQGISTAVSNQTKRQRPKPDRFSEPPARRSLICLQVVM